MRERRRQELIDRMINSHTDLNIMHAVISIMENGCVYTADSTATRIIKLAKAESARQYKRYESARAQLLKAKP